ncbi:MAG: NAD(P)/FAD-dependent oxidoreductase [Clostridia bacterium]|nr:NAD(P)/FAD-dependent oxidoreductase [Clostridia bacterium]
MAAALFAARRGASVTLLERNAKLGKKLYITGKGRCNITNTSGDMLSAIPRNPRFLFAAFSFFSAGDLCGLLDAYGCPTKTERGGRVFPVSDKASDVTRALERALTGAGVRIELGQRVSTLEPLFGAGTIVLATGGASYPATGSTGDGYRFAEKAGHTVYPARPALVPLIAAESWTRLLQGLSLRNIRLTATIANRVRFNQLGEMLFTHYGISGPLVLSLSSCILDDDLTKLRVSLDMKPGLSSEQLENRLQREFSEDPRKRLITILPRLVPARMAEIFPSIAGIPESKTAGQVTRDERRTLAMALKAIPLTISGYRPIDEAIVTRGGVCVREVDPGTMESKKRAGLYFAGEILDVDAHTGGYNLQIAFSTGALAGWSAGGRESAAFMSSGLSPVSV